MPSFEKIEPSAESVSLDEEKKDDQNVAKMKLPPGVLDPSLMPNYFNKVQPGGLTVLPLFFCLFFLCTIFGFLWMMTVGNDKPESQKALLIIDVQDCYMDNDTYSGRPGRAAVQNSSQIIKPLNALRRWNSMVDFFALTVISLVTHPPNHISFASTHDAAVDSEIELHCKTIDNNSYPYYQHSPFPAYLGRNPNIRCCNETSAKTLCQCSEDECVSVIQSVHPDNCVENVDGVLAKNLYTMSDEPENVVIVQRGVNPFIDTHSVFFESMREVTLETLPVLRSHGIEELYFAGVGFDGTIARAVQDAFDIGYKNITVFEDLVASIDADAGRRTKDEMEARGVVFLNSRKLWEIMQMHRLEKRLAENLIPDIVGVETFGMSPIR